MDDSQESQDSIMTVTQETRHEILYFAYGSNLSTRQMRQRCPFSTPVGLGFLEGWRWIINERGYANVVPMTAAAATTTTGEGNTSSNSGGSSSGSGSGSGSSSRGRKAAGVYGLLYLLPPQDEARLDGYEGVPWAYERMHCDYVRWATRPSPLEVEVEGEGDDGRGEAAAAGGDEPVRALVYVDRQRVTEGTPRDEYVGRMEEGIRDAVWNWGLDEAYADRVMRRFWRNKKGGGGGGGHPRGSI
ncbi:Cholestenol Delta-isomerase [Purpureocillium takamizusanense]|uniref:gamma-glutamylcyclotransferase n=1 Tax=Purpureocillium takamizusanense TaxID=2060973 RepID=A0A9Q8VDR1_9HYPO|nr:Cholestenol Delta-isomerase [Purpureocillium takamizusanense]UNI21471.1 Cholestenol Delta-isomerase [Purpureocillium takamizusanense]